MFLRTRNFGIAAHLVVASGAILGFGGQALADGPDVNFGIWIGTGGQTGCRAPAHDCDYAGTLTIDGRCFRIEADRSLRHQILHAFECMGYDAWCVGRSVRVRTSGCHGPEVCWRNGEYRMLFRERSSSITLTPDEICDGRDYGSHYRYGYDNAHGRYYSFSEATGVGGSASWSSLGASTFVDNDRDLDEELHAPGRTDDARVRNDRGEVRSAPAPRIDDRSSTPGRKDAETRNRVEAKPVVRLPAGKRSDVKRAEPAAPRRDEVKTLPADRLDLKRTVKPTAPVQKGDAKAPATKESKPGAKPGDDKKSKW